MGSRTRAVAEEGKTTVPSHLGAAEALSKSEAQAALASLVRLALGEALSTDDHQEGAEVAPELVSHCCKAYRRAACIPGGVR